MSESNHMAVGGPSMLTNANIGSIHGGNYYSIHGGATFQHPYSPPPSQAAIIAKAIEETIVMLETFVALPVDFRGIHQEIVDKRTAGTGESFKLRREVQNWRKRLNSFLWAKGGPGAGKTYIASCVIEWLEALAEDFPDMVIIFAYLRYSEQLTAWDIVLALIIQAVLCSHRFPEVVTMVHAAFDRYTQRKARPPLADLVKLFKAILKRYPEAFLAIDGLDEMKQEIQEFITELASSCQARVLFTSRPSPIMEDKVKGLRGGNVTFIEVTAQPEDLDLFIHEAIHGNHSLRRLLEKHKMKDEVVATIKAKAGGMFLHASLQVEMLLRCRSLHAVRATISNIPSGIEDLYARTVSRIPREDSALARLVFIWILHAKGNLTIEDLQYAVAVTPDTYQFQEEHIVSEEDLISICCGLVNVEAQSRHVRFIHYTAQESLTHILFDHKPAPHDIIARTCIARFIDCGFQRANISTLGQLRKALIDNPLLHYAQLNAPYHVREGVRSNPDLYLWAEAFARGCETFPFYPYDDLPALSLLRMSDSEPLHMLTPLHIATYLGLSRLVIRMIRDEGFDANIRAGKRDHDGFTSLAIAVFGGVEEMVELLLSLPEVDPSIPFEETAAPVMHIAAMHGYVGIIQRLIAVPGGDINQGDNIGTTMLMLACFSGQESVVKWLLETPGIEVNKTNDAGISALMYAAGSGQAAILEDLFAAPGIDINFQNAYGWTAALVAAFHGFSTATKLLLDHPQQKADLKFTSSGATILLHTLTYHLKEVQAQLHQDNYDPQPMALLLLERPEIQSLAHIPNNRGSTPLMLASKLGYLSVVERLLSLPGGDVNATDQNGETALTLALSHGQGDAAERLRMAGAIDVITDTT